MPSYHNEQLACLPARLSLSTTTISLPAILSAKVDALNNEYYHSYRTDVGLYLEQTDNAQDIALPVGRYSNPLLFKYALVI